MTWHYHYSYNTFYHALSLTWKCQFIHQSSAQRITVSEVLANTVVEFHHLMDSQAAAFIAYGTYVYQYK